MEHLFEGSAQDKWLEIIFHASQGLSAKELLRLLEKQAAMEVLLEKRLGELWEEELHYLQTSEESSEALHTKLQNIAIESMGNILSQNE